MKLPASLMNSLVDVKGFDAEAFEKVHEIDEQVVSVRFNTKKSAWASDVGTKFPFREYGERVPWSHSGQYLNYRPSFTFDPLFHAGLYYVQEASSMFLEQAWLQCVHYTKPLKVLDLAAAPGGKSTHLLSLMSRDSLLVSNEVIKSRVNVLRDNIIKWGHENIVVTNNDPKDFAKLDNYFDVILLDAPCSGSGLFRKNAEAIDEWSVNNVQLCSRRQQRILADVWPALKEDGILIYSTCSYSKEEDEEICDWLMNQFQVSGCQLKIEEGWNIDEIKTNSGAYGYRFWPYKLKGDGFFLSCFKKLDGDKAISIKLANKFQTLNNKDIELVKAWIKEGKYKFEKRNYEFLKRDNTIYAVPENSSTDINLLFGILRVNYFGVKLGELVHGKLIPDHALAMSNLVSDKIEVVDLDLENAITYLKKKELRIDGLAKGWKLVRYQGQNLGWVNVLANRINNYYPKELRILKDI